MQASFVESSNFTAWIAERLSDAEYAAVQQRLLADPTVGAAMKGCGGLRKLRVADPQRRKGRRGGLRLIYLHVPEAARFYMLDGYGKDEQDDLSADERDALAALANLLKREALAKRRRG